METSCIPGKRRMETSSEPGEFHLKVSSLPGECRVERYFAKHEFETKYLLCCSDVDALTLKEVIEMADTDMTSMWDTLKLSYGDLQGNPLLRQEVAKLHQVAASDVLIITPQEGIYVAMHCLVDHFRKQFNEDRSHVVVTYPAYQSLYENVNTLGCHVDYWMLKETCNGWMFDMEDLRKLLRPDTRLLVVNFPHNPTGYVPSSEQWAELTQLCQERNVVLFSDEMYRLSNNDGTAPLASACTIMDNAVTLFGMSKTFALPGLRIGWLCTRNPMIMKSMQSFKDYTTICSPGICEFLSTVALRNADKILQRTLRIVKTNLVLLDEFFSNYPDIFEWRAPQASTTGLLKLKGWVCDLGTGGASGLCHKLMQDAEVLLLPAKLFGMNDDYVRIGFVRENLAEVLDVLRCFLETNRPQQALE